MPFFDDRCACTARCSESSVFLQTRIATPHEDLPAHFFFFVLPQGAAVSSAVLRDCASNSVPLALPFKLVGFQQQQKKKYQICEWVYMLKNTHAYDTRGLRQTYYIKHNLPRLFIIMMFLAR